MLRISNLTVSFRRRNQKLIALDNVNLSVKEGDTLGIVGESGSGKSTLLSALFGLLPPNGSVDGGLIEFEGRGLSCLGAREWRELRGKALTIIPQDAAGSLNPVFTIGNQLAESIKARYPEGSQSFVRSRSIELLREMSVSSPEARLGAYPHTLSGGIKQRTLAAAALGAEPRILVADEPTTALDVTIQADFLQLLDTVVRRRNLTLLFVSHDLGVVASICRRLAVMYCGRIVEEGATAEILRFPRHPYTRALLDSRATVDRKEDWLTPIPGELPSPAERTNACHFAPRCNRAQAACMSSIPPVSAYGANRSAACFFPIEEPAL